MITHSEDMDSSAEFPGCDDIDDKGALQGMAAAVANATDDPFSNIAPGGVPLSARALEAESARFVDGIDLSSLGDISFRPPPKDPRTLLLEAAMAEFQSLPMNEFLRAEELYGLAYVIVGTWTGIVRGQLARLNGAPGAEKSFVVARDTRLVVEDLREPTPDGEHRVWLVPRIPGLPLKLWLTIGDRNVPHYFVFTPDSWERVSEATYLATRTQRNWV